MSYISQQNESTPLDLNTFLISIGIIFTIGTLISLIIITRQVMKSRWIDKVSFIILLVVWFMTLCMLCSMWIAYAFYTGFF